MLKRNGRCTLGLRGRRARLTRSVNESKLNPRLRFGLVCSTSRLPKVLPDRLAYLNQARPPAVAKGKQRRRLLYPSIG
jgi:hypothetical protein